MVFVVVVLDDDDDDDSHSVEVVAVVALRVEPDCGVLYWAPMVT